MLGTELPYVRRIWRLLVEDFDSSVAYVYNTLEARKQPRPMWRLFPTGLSTMARDFWVLLSSSELPTKRLFVRRYVAYLLFFSLIGLLVFLILPDRLGLDYALAYIVTCLSVFLLSEYAGEDEGAMAWLLVLSASLLPLAVFYPIWLAYLLPIVLTTIAYIYWRRRAPTPR